MLSMLGAGTLLDDNWNAEGDVTQAHSSDIPSTIVQTEVVGELAQFPVLRRAATDGELCDNLTELSKFYKSTHVSWLNGDVGGVAGADKAVVQMQVQNGQLLSAVPLENGHQVRCVCRNCQLARHGV